MALHWTYTASPAQPRDKYRLLTGDTRYTGKSTQITNFDEEIDLIVNTNVGAVDEVICAKLYEILAGKCADKVQSAIGDLRRWYQQQFDHYKGLATRQWQLSAGLIPDEDGGGSSNRLNVGSIGLPVAGGLSSPRLFGKTLWPDGYDPALATITDEKNWP